MRFMTILLLALAGFYPAHAEDISESDLRQHIEILASDEFGGRKPGTIGENKTVNYIATKWAQAGLVPAASMDSWYAPVRLIERKPVKQVVRFILSDGKRSKKIGVIEDQIVLRGSVANTALSNIALVHGGYGLGTPERLRESVEGKIALIYFASPSSSEDGTDYRERKANLIAAGARGVLTIVKGEAGWKRLSRRYYRVNSALDDAGGHAELEGLISNSQVKKLLKRSAIDRAGLEERAKQAGFMPIKMPVSVSVTVETEVRRYVSHNVVGRIAGSKVDAGAILFLGHWDHFGTCGTADASEPEKDIICNGAVDNASGISLLIELAKRLAKTQPDRDIYFLATTAEERGLLGAKAFVRDPASPLDQLLAVFNADTVALAPDGKKIAIVGRGETTLDDDLKKIARNEGREIDTSDKANAFIKRQDGYAFLQQGISALMITSAFSDEERLNAYLKGPYHDVGDELNDDLLLGGAADDANFHVALGRYFGSTDTYPEKATSDNLLN